MERIADVLDESLFLRNEVELSSDIAVDTLTSLTTNGDNSSVGTSNLLVDSDRRNTDFRILPGTTWQDDALLGILP